MTGSNNKIVVWVEDAPVLHQFVLNDIAEKLDYINEANLSSEKLTKVRMVAISGSARNAVIVGINDEKTLPSTSRGREKDEPNAYSFFIFKL